MKFFNFNYSKMSNESLNITFFDINGEYNEEEATDKMKNFQYIESPNRIINQYIADNFPTNISKNQKEDDFITKISFSQKLENNFLVTINCDIINNFSVSHQDTFDSNGYIIFCNLENNSTSELLDKIINYIYDNCSIFIKTYVVGVFQDHIDEDKSYNKMEELLKNINSEMEFEYYEMFVGDKTKYDEIKKMHENALNMNEVFKNVFIQILKEKSPQLVKINKENNKIDDRSKVQCEIF